MNSSQIRTRRVSSVPLYQSVVRHTALPCPFLVLAHEDPGTRPFDPTVPSYQAVSAWPNCGAARSGDMWAGLGQRVRFGGRGPTSRDPRQQAERPCGAVRQHRAAWADGRAPALRNGRAVRCGTAQQTGTGDLFPWAV